MGLTGLTADVLLLHVAILPFCVTVVTMYSEVTVLTKTREAELPISSLVTPLRRYAVFYSES